MTSAQEGGPAALTTGLRDLVWGIESEVAQITRLSSRIDQHVRDVNELRREAAQRLAVLDELLDVAADDDLRAWLERVGDVPLPQVTEKFPDRLYTD